MGPQGACSQTILIDAPPDEQALWESATAAIAERINAEKASAAEAPEAGLPEAGLPEAGPAPAVALAAEGSAAEAPEVGLPEAADGAVTPKGEAPEVAPLAALPSELPAASESIPASQPRPRSVEELGEKSEQIPTATQPIPVIPARRSKRKTTNGLELEMDFDDLQDVMKGQ
eukprot:360090-Alexandrium_andersonii.AAC.1